MADYLESRIATHKRRYERILTTLKVMIESELEGVDNGIYEPSSAIASELTNLVSEGAALKALIDIKENSK